MKELSTIYLAGGCFWGLEHLLKSKGGIVDTEVGYTGGRNEDPTYEYHPGHAEAVRVSFDPGVISREDVLKYFFTIHDPTTKLRQGNDVGSSYRSAIFYQSEQEKKEVEKIISEVDGAKVYKAPIVTTLEEYTKFYSAEEYHQDYLTKNPGGYTCHYERGFNL